MSEKGGGKINWPLMVSVCALAFGMATFIINLSREDAEDMSDVKNRVTTLECVTGINTGCRK